MQTDYPLGQGGIHLLVGDITEMKVDAVVNAANARLIMGGGVAGAIRRKGGPEIQQECDRIGGTYVGGAVITTAGRLPAKHVIHAVGPMMGEGDEDAKLANATLNSLKLAEKNALKSIAFPAISTGIFGYPVDRCARIMTGRAMEFLTSAAKLRDIYFVLYDQKTYDVFKEALDQRLEN